MIDAVFFNYFNQPIHYVVYLLGEFGLDILVQLVNKFMNFITELSYHFVD